MDIGLAVKTGIQMTTTVNIPCLAERGEAEGGEGRGEGSGKAGRSGETTHARRAELLRLVLSPHRPAEELPPAHDAQRRGHHPHDEVGDALAAH
mgnify:CR=1 FL=1